MEFSVQECRRREGGKEGRREGGKEVEVGGTRVRTNEGESYGCLVGSDEGSRGASGNVRRGVTRVFEERGERKHNRYCRKYLCSSISGSSCWGVGVPRRVTIPAAQSMIGFLLVSQGCPRIMLFFFPRSITKKHWMESLSFILRWRSI